MKVNRRWPIENASEAQRAVRLHVGAPNTELVQAKRAPDAARPPTLAAPAINVLLQPSSYAMGNMNTASVRLAAALRAKLVDPAAPRMTQP